MSDKQTSLREQIEAAYESVESETVELRESGKEDISNEGMADDANNTQTDKSHNVPSEDEAGKSPQNTGISPDDTNLVPVNWSQEDKDSFLELDEKGRKLYLKRYKEMEGGFTKKSQGLAEERRVAENFKKAISQHEDHLRNLGIDPFMAVDKLLQTERLFRTGTPGQKAAALKQLMNDYQLQIHNETSSQTTQVPVDPQLQALWDEQAKTRQYLNYLETEKQHHAEQQILTQINDFSSSKDDRGDLKYPHFEEVRETMGKIINAGLAKNLEKAYKLAILENEDLREEYLLRQTNESKRIEDAKKRTAASKQAGFNVKSGSNAQVTEPEQKLSRRELIAKEYESQLKRTRI